MRTLLGSQIMKPDGIQLESTNLHLYHKRRLSPCQKKSCKVLMMMKAAKLGWAEAGGGKKQGWTKSRTRKGRSRAGQEQGRSRSR